jgi:hypothetical protein
MNWRECKVTDCEFSVRSERALLNHYGKDVTLGQIAEDGIAAIKQLPNIGARSAKEIFALIADVRKGELAQMLPEPSQEVKEWVHRNKHLVAALMAGQLKIIATVETYHEDPLP